MGRATAGAGVAEASGRVEAWSFRGVTGDTVATPCVPVRRLLLIMGSVTSLGKASQGPCRRCRGTVELSSTKGSAVAQVGAVEEMLAVLESADRMVLVRLAEQGRGLDAPPSFRGRCLEPAYLDAVAAGAWSPDDEALLAQYEERLEVVALSRVRRLDRRALRTVLRGALLARLTAHLEVLGWQERRGALSRTWDGVAAGLPAPRVPALPG